jgi:hypothetical protein
LILTGEDIHKSQLAERLGKPHTFKVSAVLRNCKSVFDRFVVADERGRYRIDAAYCSDESEADQKGGRPCNAQESIVKPFDDAASLVPMGIHR